MKLFLQRWKTWYLRRFRGYVAAPQIAGSRGTAWQQYSSRDVFPGITGSAGQTRRTVLFWVFCRCGKRLDFTSENYFIREQEHAPDCDQVPCSCPVIDARYCKVCPGCGLGHWMACPESSKGVSKS